MVKPSYKYQIGVPRYCVDSPKCDFVEDDFDGVQQLETVPGEPKRISGIVALTDAPR